MTIGDWTIDDAGKIKHLKCDQDATWNIYHRCFVVTRMNPLNGILEGHYETIRVPDFVNLIAKAQYEIWTASREPWYGKV